MTITNNKNPYDNISIYFIEIKKIDNQTLHVSHGRHICFIYIHIDKGPGHNS